jgi:hypothetical protein
MHRLTINGVTYVFTSYPDFELARNIARRLTPERERFEAELARRWVQWHVEEKQA